MQQDGIEASFANILEEVAKLSRADITADRRLREDLGIDSGRGRGYVRHQDP
jgi:acyl carrier protein